MQRFLTYYSRLDEVKVLSTFDKSQKPIKNSDSIRVYHGTASIETILLTLTKGLSGNMRVPRIYSYESNNNPKGLFVTPDLKTAKEFGEYVLEFHAKAGDMEAPVWPKGSFTVQGEYAEYFSSNDDRKAEMDKQRKAHKQSEFDYVSKSDDPYLAYWLLHGGEKQALFKGNLNPNSVRAIWVSKDPTRIGQAYIRYKAKEFLNQFNSFGIPSRFSGKVYTPANIDLKIDMFRAAEMRLFKPRDNPTFSDLVTQLAKKNKYLDKTKIAEILKNNHEMIRSYVWSDDQYENIVKEINK